ncbi:MAG: AmmeMemoRadiSam system protein B [bacterium]|nr:AmmeMemoRadiSam system protein B [bacterium]
MSFVRPYALAGSWYPGDASQLAAMVDGFLAVARQARDAPPAPAGPPWLGLAPHAGYLYSGPVAGRLFACLPDRPPRRLVILAPNHRARLARPALSGAAAFATPLGEVPVDAASVARLAASGAFAVDDQSHRHEHAIEIQLPFVQRRWPEACLAIVPVLVPRLDEAGRVAAAAALAAERDEGTLVLVSTDLTHYGASYGFAPYAGQAPDDLAGAIEKLDAGALLRVLAGDGPGLLDYGRRTGITMCGLEAAALALEGGPPPGHEAALLGYARSGDRDGDYISSVSYAAALLTGGGRGAPREAP